MNISSTEWVMQATPPLSSARRTVVPPTARLLIRSYSNFLTLIQVHASQRVAFHKVCSWHACRRGPPFYERDPRKPEMT